MGALKEALAHERAPKEAEDGAQADAVKREAIQTARQKVAKEKGSTEAEIRAWEAEKAWLQRAREEQTARAHEEAKKRAADEEVGGRATSKLSLACTTPIP